MAGYQFFVPMIVTSWQKVYGNIYGSPSEAFKAPYASYIENLLPNPTLTYYDAWSHRATCRAARPIRPVTRCSSPPS